jgi:hypothetical protein
MRAIGFSLPREKSKKKKNKLNGIKKPVPMVGGVVYCPFFFSFSP